MSLYLRNRIKHMNCKSIYIKIFFLTLLIFSSIISFAQVQQPAQITKVSGVITDAKTKQTLPFVNVFAGDSSVNVRADNDGKYLLEAKPGKSFNKINVSYVGYKPTSINVTPNQ